MNTRLFERLVESIEQHLEIARGERKPSRQFKVDGSTAKDSNGSKQSTEPLLPALRFTIPESAQILRCSRARLYTLITTGAIKAQKDGSRRYISMEELHRYVAACDTAAR